MRTGVVEGQVVSILIQLKPPKKWRKGIAKAVSEPPGERNLDERVAKTKSVMTRTDTRWDHRFFTSEEEYLEQHVRLQMELEQLTSIPDDSLEQAFDLLENFEEHWNRLAGDNDAQYELVALILERVYVRHDRAVAMTLQSDYHQVLGHKTNGPTYQQFDPLLYRSGSDENGDLTCIPM